ncbi:hypothetical protein FOE78_01685 [Microlunatus elymi]|uniref:Uncharacterized protein n=1 Tax=Microlunatus elymi TaxID=2596828 RepID=A0A516PUD3_9ACTN|nr:hypothetical protein [Microlunatus elymi]QDP94798.1 hypothetical protein FOE78_01685 [Microlunatus elymi]
MSNQAISQGTALPVATHSDAWPVEVIGLGESPRERKDKATPAGEVTYSSGCILRRRQKDGSVRVDKSASINVINPAATYELGVVYLARGRVYVMPYESNGRMALSITVEGLFPAEQASAPARPSKTEAA